jgi:hypothetical protein
MTHEKIPSGGKFIRNVVRNERKIKKITCRVHREKNTALSKLKSININERKIESIFL